MTRPEPGDFAVVSAGGIGGPLIDLAERLNGAGPFAAYQHAFIYTGHGGGEDIIQAEPSGAAYGPLTGHAETLWSTGRIRLTTVQRTAIVAAADGYVGTPYSFLDYAALAAHHWHVRVPGLRRYIAATGHMICSQLADRCYQDAGVHLFADHRWNGYVTPPDLARIIT